MGIENGTRFRNGHRKLESGVMLSPSRSDLDIFLAVGEGSDLAQRRLLGIIAGVSPDQDIEQFLEQHLELDYDELYESPEKLLKLLQRFFKTEEVTIESVRKFFDDEMDQVKDNVTVVRCRTREQTITCYLKYIEEGPRRECLAMRLNNLLTDEPVPFMASGFTSLQLGVPGVTLDYFNGQASPAQWVAYHRSLGRADEYARLLQLGDRKAKNIVLRPDKRPVNIDFGTGFSRYEPLHRYCYPTYPEYMDDFAVGKQEAQRTIRTQYEKHRPIIHSLLDKVDDELVETMNKENERGIFLITESPRDTIFSYLSSIGITL